MADIRPFRGVHYNRSAGDLAELICPPYDIISPQLRQELYRRNEHNFVRLEYEQELPGDTDSQNKYTRSAALLQQWLAQGVLTADGAPAIYRHDHYFTLNGQEHRRQGLTALVKLEEWDKKVVRPHEGTLAAPKGDRLNLLWALQANTSPIFALFEDSGQQVASLLAAAQGEPLLDIDRDGEQHRVWAITGEAADEIGRLLADQPLYIADGHHRYESALKYRQERRACSPGAPADEPYDFVMMTLVDFSDPGLVILPAHRLVRGVSPSALDRLRSSLPSFFKIEEVPVNSADTAGQITELLARPEGQVKLVLFGLGDNLIILRLRDVAAAARMMPNFHSELYKRLDVSIVDHVVLEKMLGMQDRESAALSYSYDIGDTIGKVMSREYGLAILLNPVKARDIKSIADAGDRMPRKSTYFSPKLPAGLVIYRWAQAAPGTLTPERRLC
ncbi:MAG: DUF1015 domain-containing protein [Chloroflexota bacterium]